MELLGILKTKANEELGQMKGAQVRLGWLREVYDQCCIEQP